MKQKKIPKSFHSWIEKRMRDTGELDKIDIKAHYDKSLTLAENKTQFEQKFGIFFKAEQPKLTKKEQQRIANEQLFEQNIKNLNERFGIELEFV